MFEIPTLSALIDRTKGDLNARMGSQNALIRRSLAWVLAHVQAGAVWGLYQYQAWIARQVIPDTADTDALVRWARIFGLRKTEPTRAVGQVGVTAIAGSSLGDGALYQRADRVEYRVTGGPYTWPQTGTLGVSIEALEPGSAGNYTDDGATLELVSPPAGVVASAPVAAGGLSGGSDLESDESLLDRLLRRLQSPPQGGAVTDYEQWAQEALSSVARVWVHGPDDGLPDGTVDVRFSVEGDAPIPTAGDVDTVRAYVTARSRAPVGATISVSAVSEHPVTLALTIAPDAGADIDDLKGAVITELRSMFRDRAEARPQGATVANSYLLEAIGDADGVDTFALTAVDGGPATANIALGAYEYPTVDVDGITWTFA